MEKRPKAVKPPGRSAASTSYDNWLYRLKNGGAEFNRRTEGQGPRKEK